MADTANAPSSSSGPPKRRLKKVIRAAALAGAVIGVGIQFVPVKGIGVNPTERFKVEAPPEVEAILRRACFDCHSNETRWPWYAKLAPGSWLMIRDVKKGRSHFNMSDWGETDDEERSIDKENGWELVEKGEMPPWFYLPLHPDARLTDVDKALLKAWMMAGAGKDKPSAKPPGG